MEEVYVLVKSWMYGGVDYGEDVYVFETLENAKKRLNQEMVRAKEDAQREAINIVDIVEDKDDMSYSVYMDGEYCFYHIDITIYQREIM